MEKTKCALLDTDFISKLHITRKDDDNRLIDRILELPDYTFACHEQIVIELGRHNSTAHEWLNDKIKAHKIVKYTDRELISSLHEQFGKNAHQMYLYYLKMACDLFSSEFYETYYGTIEESSELTDDELAVLVAGCDVKVGCDNNLGEIKTYLLQQILNWQEEIQLYVFCSDDRHARAGISNAAGIPCISAIASFYVLKQKINLEKSEAKIYFDSWIRLHRQIGQTEFKVHQNTKAMQLMKMDGYAIFEAIYNNRMVLLKNGNLKIKDV